MVVCCVEQLVNFLHKICCDPDKIGSPDKKVYLADRSRVRELRRVREIVWDVRTSPALHTSCAHIASAGSTTELRNHGKGGGYALCKSSPDSPGICLPQQQSTRPFRCVYALDPPSRTMMLWLQQQRPDSRTASGVASVSGGADRLDWNWKQIYQKVQYLLETHTTTTTAATTAEPMPPPPGTGRRSVCRSVGLYIV